MITMMSEGVSFLVFFGCRAPGGKKARQEATARKERKEERKEGGREARKEGSTEGGQEERRKEGGRAGRKEGTVFLFTCALETLAVTVRFAKP